MFLGKAMVLRRFLPNLTGQKQSLTAVYLCLSRIHDISVLFSLSGTSGPSSNVARTCLGLGLQQCVYVSLHKFMNLEKGLASLKECCIFVEERAIQWSIFFFLFQNVLNHPLFMKGCLKDQRCLIFVVTVVQKGMLFS